MVKISYSRVQSYLSCPYSHYLRYVDKLSKKSKSRALSFGTDFHSLLERRADPEQVKKQYKKITDAYYDLPAQQQNDLGDTYLDDLKSIYTDYTKVYKEQPIPYLTEQQFDIELGKYKGEPVIFTGVIDELYETDNGLIIGEHKTFSKKPPLLKIVMNTQKCLYAKAVQLITGSLPERVIWDYIRSTPAVEPVWLEKSQKLSTAKNDNVTPYSFRRACKSHGITDETVLKQEELYTGNVSNFFFRLEEEYIPEMVNDIYSGFVYTAKDICRQGEKNKSKHTGEHCSWCDYKDICYAELTNGNVDYIIEKDYVRRDNKNAGKSD